MAAINPPKYSKQEVSQRFNLKELLGYEPSEEQKALFYELAVDKMVQRTANGKDINGSKFAPYSEDYAEKKGVSRNSVDLILSGEMLSSFEESQTQKNIVKIKMSEGEQTLKSFNHCVGDTLPKRTFFGIKDGSEVASIIKQVDSISDDEPEERKSSGIDLASLREATRLISADFTGFDGED